MIGHKIGKVHCRKSGRSRTSGWNVKISCKIFRMEVIWWVTFHGAYSGRRSWSLSLEGPVRVKMFVECLHLSGSREDSANPGTTHFSGGCFSVAVVLCAVECFAPFLASTHWVWVALLVVTNKMISSCCSMPPWAKIASREDYQRIQKQSKKIVVSKGAKILLGPFQIYKAPAFQLINTVSPVPTPSPGT